MAMLGMLQSVRRCLASRLARLALCCSVRSSLALSARSGSEADSPIGLEDADDLAGGNEPRPALTAVRALCNGVLEHALPLEGGHEHVQVDVVHAAEGGDMEAHAHVGAGAERARAGEHALDWVGVSSSQPLHG